MPVRTNPDWSDWAREQLELDESVRTDSVRRVYLQRLSDEDFMPPAHLPYALAVLEGRAGPPGANEEAVQADIADRQRQRVEEFAHRFFQIPLDQRREQWLQLKADCAGVPTLAKRLDRLEPGLVLDPNKLAVADAKVRELIQEASKIFVLRPFDAAQARAAFFRRQTDKSEAAMIRWETAARNLKNSYPRYEVLAPELIQQVSLWRTRAKELSRRRKLAPLRPPGSLVVNLQPVPTASAPSADNTNSKPPYWLIYVAVMVIGGVVKALSGSSSPTTGPSNFRQDQFKNYNIEEMLRQTQQTEEHRALMKTLQGKKVVSPELEKLLKSSPELEKRLKSLPQEAIAPGKDGLNPIDKMKKAPEPPVVPLPKAPPLVPTPDPANKRNPSP